MDKTKLLFGGGMAILIVGVIAWAFIESSRPRPGIEYPDQGRDHIPLTEKFEFNSNPPTSGKHNADWIRAGIYETPKEDPYLVHSLEHGYIIMSYNCAFKQSLIPTSYAHGLEATESASTEASNAANLSEDFRSDECHKLVDQLISIYEKKGKKKLIVIPRPNLDAKIALTAWRRLDKFNQFDESRIIKFIDALRDQGPEKTME